jgi:hypothetical protein
MRVQIISLTGGEKMKSRTVLGIAAIVVALSVAVTAHAQPDEARYAKYDFQKLMRAFDSSLRSNIPGIVESTIYNLVEYKSFFPDREYSRLVQTLSDVARSSVDSTIAYKASLAGMYLSYGARLDDASVFTPYNHETAFKVAADQLVKKFLLSRSSE